jgi:1,4-dihydroxy-2-naphthoate octaprenyltransferase
MRWLYACPCSFKRDDYDRKIDEMYGIMMRIKEKIIAWLKLAHVFFYPFNWVIYNIGVAVAYTTAQRFDLGVYVLGYICLFLVELGMVFINDYFDYPTDRVNKNAGICNGGSRVLVEGKLGFNEVKAGIFVLLCLIPVFGYLLIQTAKDVSAFSILFLLLFGIFLGWGYSLFLPVTSFRLVNGIILYHGY